MEDKRNTLKEWSLVNFCEFDKYAEKSYCRIHDVDPSLNLGDITKVDEKRLNDFDLMTWGFPCTDLSAAGRQKGFIDENGNKTRSGMYYEGIRILREKKPKISIIENVKALTTKKFVKEFQMVLDDLDEAGYNTYYKILNAKDYGIPQNRERIFIISIRKDIDNGKFVFPEPFQLKLRLKDMLDDKADEKYYLSKKMIKYITNRNEKWTGNNNGALVNKDIASTINTGEGSRRCDASNYICNELPDNANLQAIREFGIFDNDGKRHQAGSVWNKDGLSPTIDTMQGGYRQPMVKDENMASYVNQTLEEQKVVQDGWIQKSESGTKHQSNTVYNVNGLSPTLTACDYKSPLKFTDIEDLCIRKLTPKECFRLMGFGDELFDKIEGVSNTRLYMQAGNSIVVDVIYYIFTELYKAIPEVFDNLTVTSLFSGIGAFEVALDRLYKNVINKEY